jgi:hypothetical protein
LIHAHSAGNHHNAHHKAVELSTYGILFLGTPHQGTDGIDLAMLLLGIQSIYSKTNDSVLKDLQNHSPVLQQQLSQYTSISGYYETKFYFELYPTPLFGGLPDRVVGDYPVLPVSGILTPP